MRFWHRRLTALFGAKVDEFVLANQDVNLTKHLDEAELGVEV